ATAHRGSVPWTGSAQARARAPARSVRLPRSLQRSRLARGLDISSLAVVVLPVALLLQGISDFLRHVGLVVLGEHGIRLEYAGTVERTLGNHALPFTEQIRQNAFVGDRKRRAAVGYLETDR